MKVFILGHRGMLGHVAARYLADAGFEILTSDRRYDGSPRDPLVEEVRCSGAAWVVNAIGRIKQKCCDPAQLLRANAQLPVHLAARLAPGQRLVHASSDCVFSGRAGWYRTGDERDADDDYGFSKVLGESAAVWDRCQIFRVSMVGPERHGGHGLLGWFFQQTRPVDGFTNHRWNGITTLEWCKRAAALMDGSWTPPGAVVQFASAQPVSKYELLQLAAGVWDHRIEIRPTAAPMPVDRTLVGDVVCAPFDQQLGELRQWYEARFGAVQTGGSIR
jgi:dTDP-4-dehydrorhamnose reductase